MHAPLFEIQDIGNIEGQLAYFSHSINTYDKDEDIYNFLTQIFEGFVICPKRHLGKLSNPKDYAIIARNTDCIFVSPLDYNNKIISTGCYSEVKAALENNIQVFLINKIENAFVLKKVLDVVRATTCPPFHYSCILSDQVV